MMEPALAPPSRHVQRRMSAQARMGTDPELRIRRALFKQGLRYRCGYPVPGKPRRTIDVAFTKQKVAVFVDGCFWHGCPDHFIAPKSNSDWWLEKIRTNQRRDADTNAILESAGWRVVRVWEHVGTDQATTAIASALRTPPS